MPTRHCQAHSLEIPYLRQTSVTPKNQLRMRKISLFLTLAALLSCQQSPTPPSQPQDANTTRPPIAAIPANSIASQSTYTDPAGGRVTVQNGFPKGGLTYTDRDGVECGYAVFWSRVINETAHPLTLQLDLPARSYPLANFPGAFLEVLAPADTMTADRLPLPSYGLTDIPAFLEAHHQRGTTFTRTIQPNATTGLYFVLRISTAEASGMTRTALWLQGQDLVYHIARHSVTKPITLVQEEDIPCGRIDVQGLRLLR